MKSKIFDVLRRLAGKGVFPHEFAWMLLNPLRNLVLSPEKLIRRMGLNEHSMVLEIGPGPGFYSAKVAQSIPQGMLHITDIQAEMLDITQRRLRNKKITNVDFKLGDGVTLPYENNQFDVVFMVTVFGEVAHKDLYLKEIYRILRSDGVLSISEQAGDSDNMTVAEIQTFVEKFGFKTDKVYGKNRTFTANFRKI